VTDFHRHVADYLQLRRSLGFKPGFCARVLPQLASYLEASGAPVLTAQLAICWAGLPEGVQPIILAHRLGAARGLARYLQAIDPPPRSPRPESGPRPLTGRPRTCGRQAISAGCWKPPMVFGPCCGH
jgi:hypothetical protein